MKTTDATFLIDVSSFVFRAYYALAPLSSKGRPSHAVVGFATTLFKILREKKPKACVLVFDSKSPTFRKELYPEYKANRQAPPPDLSEQIQAIREFAEKGGFPILQREGFEADDWIASFVKQKKHQPIYIVSTDKDLMQLVCEKVHLYDAFKERVIGPKEVKEKWGVDPSQIWDLLALTGDSSDNIPGVQGVGPKTAASLLQKYGSVDKILKHLDELPEKMRLKFEGSRSDIDMSVQLVKLKEDLDLPFESVRPLELPLPSEAKDFLVDWDCHRLLDSSGDILGSGKELAKSQSSLSGSHSVTLTLVESEEDLKRILKEVESIGLFAFDVETNSFNRWKSELVGLSIAFTSEQAWYLPVRHGKSSLNMKDVKKFLGDLLENSKIYKLAHNLKFDREILEREGFKLSEPFHDTMIEAHLLHADRRGFSLGALSQDFLAEQKGDLETLLQGSEDFSVIPLDQAVQYAAQDAHLCFQLHQRFWPELQKSSALWLYENVEVPLVEVLGAMERTGIKLDASRLQALSNEFHNSMGKIQKEIYGWAGKEFNIQSPKQLAQILFEELKLPPQKKTKTGYSTDESVLEDLAEVHELPKLILKYRSLSKLTSTYVDVLPSLIDSKDGRVHTNYHQTGTATGRLSSSEPNLQNIPVRSPEGAKIREAFIADEGYKLLSADYSQVELRLFAHMADDANLIKAFHSGRDIHSETAKIIFGSSASEFREKSKAINYGIVYGISAFGLSKQLGSSRSEAAEFMEAYFKSFPRLKTYMEELVELTRKRGYSETLFGRRRPLPDIHSKNPTLRQMAERMAINAPVQGTAADIMKAALVRVARKLKNGGFKSRVLLQVHDELVLEVKTQEEAQVQDLVVTEMQDLSQTPIKALKVPLLVEVGLGSKWSDLV